MYVHFCTAIVNFLHINRVSENVWEGEKIYKGVHNTTGVVAIVPAALGQTVMCYLHCVL